MTNIIESKYHILVEVYGNTVFFMQYTCLQPFYVF